MPSKHPKKGVRRSVSMRRDSWERMRAQARAAGVSASSLVEGWIDRHCAPLSVSQRIALAAAKVAAPKPAPRPPAEQETKRPAPRPRPSRGRSPDGLTARKVIDDNARLAFAKAAARKAGKGDARPIVIPKGSDAPTTTREVRARVPIAAPERRW